MAIEFQCVQTRLHDGAYVLPWLALAKPMNMAIGLAVSIGGRCHEP